MKFIENTPVRNSIIPKTDSGGSSTAAYQKQVLLVEQLKRELTMRDMIAATSSSSDGSEPSGPWYPQLTKAQRKKTTREVLNEMTE